MSKGGSETTSTVHQENLPEYARPYFESLMQRGQDESMRPYQAYPGQRLADQSTQTLAGLNMAQNWAQSGTPDLANARSLSNMVGQQAMDLQNYQAGKVTNSYTGPQDYATGQFNADQVGFGGDLAKQTSQNFGAEQRDQYMSPYMDSVVEASQRDAQQKALEEQGRLNAQAGTTGGFGGSRAAMQVQMANNDAQRRIADIGVQGRQSAFENAQQQFERDQQRNMAAQSGNQGAALQMALANQSKNLEAMGMGEQSRQFGAQLGEQGRQTAAQLGMQAQTDTEKLRQGGKQLGLQGLELAGNTAGQLAGFQGLQDQMSMDRFKTMLGIGASQDDRQQQQLNMGYEDFMNQVNYPMQRLTQFGALMHGVPVGANQNTTTTTPSNPLAALLGYGMANNAMNRLNTQQQPATT